MSDAFNYLSVLLSIIVGLAITQILKGFRGILLSRAHIRIYWPSLAWAVLLLVMCVEVWWSQFGMLGRSDWTLPMFYSVLLQFIIAYMLAAIVLPDFFGDRDVDLHEHYFSHQHWFFGLLIAELLSSILKEYVMGGGYSQPANLVFHIVFLAATVLAMTVRNETFHKAAAVFAVTLFSVYTVLLFWHLK
jgi:hypothetical protein